MQCMFRGEINFNFDKIVSRVVSKIESRGSFVSMWCVDARDKFVAICESMPPPVSCVLLYHIFASPLKSVQRQESSGTLGKMFFAPL